MRRYNIVARDYGRGFARFSSLKISTEISKKKKKPTNHPPIGIEILSEMTLRSEIGARQLVSRETEYIPSDSLGI